MPNGRNGSAYDDSNRAFLQVLMARSTITFPQSKPILAAIFSVHEDRPISPDDITEDDLSSFIIAANTAISPFDLEIRSTLPQIQIRPGDTDTATPERIYALVNTTSDGLTQLATTYTADEISFVKRVLDRMFETNNNRITEAMAISSIDAIQCAKVTGEGNRRESGSVTQQTQSGAAQSLSMTQAEVVMKQLVEDKWFEQSRRGFYTLSPRGLMELRGWLVATYNDENEHGRRNDKIKFCAACKDIITIGQRCGNRECAGRLHDHCMRNFFRVQKAEQCPICRAPWPGDKYVGERAVASGQGRRGDVQPRRSAVAPTTQGTQLSDQEMEDDSD
ncbi:Nse1 non-SMC component of SMC5-6 complex-domain-containing protein [Aspergillus granulosus]|uniref:Non-structural maintenance of chromosomes element 1 homolog n=1 Tax=Aspergillus granulosus TaxID=176169 RepID=A0ABR4HMF9_9EURO